MLGAWTIRDFQLAGEIRHAHLQEIDIISVHETSLWLLQGFLFDVLPSVFLLIDKGHLQEAS